jgi:hypothetical protein
MPHLDLSEDECKVAWIVLDHHAPAMLPTELWEAERSLFDKVYRAYRGMPPKAA